MEQTDYGRGRKIDYIKPSDKVDPSLTLEQCLERRAALSETLSEISEAIESIRNQLESADASQKVTGVAPHPIWQARAIAAQRYYSRQHRDYSRALGAINQRINKLEGATGINNEAFVAHAKAILPPPIFESIWTRVNNAASAQ